MVEFEVIVLAIVSLIFMSIIAKIKNPRSNLPPGPSGLPIIGNLHQLRTNHLSDHLWQLSKLYGPLMSMRLGRVQAVVVSSPQMAKEVLKTNDTIFCSRPVFTGQRMITYGYKGLVLTPYNDYWREMRKVCTLHLFTQKRVQSFCPDREKEVFLTIDSIRSQITTPGSVEVVINLNEMIMTLTSTIICRIAYGKRQGQEMSRFHELLLECQAVLVNFYFRDHFPLMGWLDHLNGSMARLKKNFDDMDEFYQELVDEHLNPKRPKLQDDIVDILLGLKKDDSCSFGLTFDHIKAILMDIFLAGTETVASTVVWAMTLLIKNPKALKMVRQEVMKIIGNKGKVEEDDLQMLNYLKAVIKESLRLYPVAPLLVPHETIDKCVLAGYTIPKKTLVYVNVWAIGRDPKTWENPNEFQPERFMGSNIDYKGLDFEFIPFGSGRRGCPGMSLGATTVELILSNLIYAFEWNLPNGMKAEDIDTLTTPGIVLHKKNALCLVPSLDSKN
ncbi:6,7,8-trihydroxycoumarin synthase-like [Bidens hawaiensis]|uniref:6,7,8-trihydroxycoumarin synthase-like n=1 Tax=Bidens hawaiensis TaxID=980011 RepID=UPI00404B8F02